MKLTGIRQKVFLDRYALKDKKGKPLEKTPEQMWRRVAKGIAQVEKKGKRRQWAKKFYQAMKDFKYVPGGRILSGAGTGYKVTYYNCFVLPSPHDSRDGILDNLKKMVEIMARGGGVGINLSSLRPRGARVRKVNGFSSGPINWAELYSVATHDIIQQGGCFAPNTKIMTHRGLVSVEEVVKSDSTYFAATHEGYKKITAKFDNGIKDIFEVKTKAGFKVTVTKEHRFVTFNKNGEFCLKPLKNLKKGDCIVLLLGNWLDELPYVPLNSKLPRPSKYSYGLKKIKLPEVLDEDLAFILGVYAAGGSKIPDEYSPNGKGIRLAVDAKRTYDLAILVETIKRVFGIDPKIRDGDGAVKNVQLFSRALCEFLHINNFLKVSASVTVPKQIFTSPRKVVEAYIAGVFFGDGTNRGGKGGLRIATVSKKFAQQLQLLLINLGIPAKIKVRRRRHENWHTMFTVTVNGATFMKRFIKFLAPYTDKVLDKKISVRDGTFGWPFNVVDRFAYLTNFQRTMARSNPTTSQKAVAFLQQNLSSIAVKDREDVAMITGCVPDKIDSITAKGKSPVYDLEVEKVHLLSGNGIYTSNSRRGALMLMLWDWHPDIEEFITVKKDLSRITGANLSVCISDKFMEAVKKDKDWDLVFPDLDDAEYDEKWRGYLDEWKAMGKKVKVYKTVKARKLWDLICQAAWESAEPGTVFMERYNKWYNNWYFNKINCVNPCVTGDTLVATEAGWIPARDLKPGLKIATPHGFKPIKKVYNNGKQRIFKVKFSDGGELKATADHKLKVVKEKKYKWVTVSDLVTGDKVVVLDKTYLPGENPEVSKKLKEIVDENYFMSRTNVAKVKEVIDTGTYEEVFDVYEPETLTWITNGYVSRDCGEEGLPEYGVCNLGSINLSQFVDDKGKMDYKKLKEIVHIAVRFQDDVIDGDIYIFPEIKKTQLEGERRIGLGTMGLGDALIKMKIRYGSEKSLKVIDKIYRTIRDEAYAASVKIAKEKGPFPKFEADKYLKGYFIKRLPKRIRQGIKKYGIRNSLLLMQAPTGSTSLLAGTTSGIEPVYEFSFIRRDRLGEHKLYHPLFDAWRKKHPGEPVPEYFVSANDLTPEDHVRVQAVIQKYVDASISKTVNAPKTYTVEDVKKLYTLAYDLGCKGITFMREGSRPGVLERETEEKEKKVEKTALSEQTQAMVIKKTPRPYVVKGATYQVHTPVGIAYVTINTVDEKEPLEVFINIGKAGSDVQAMAEALGRIISLNLRMASPLTGKERIKLVFNELIGIGGSRPLGFGANRVRSLPDAVAKAIAQHFNFEVRNGEKLKLTGNSQTKSGIASSLKKLGDRAKSLLKPLSAQDALPYFTTVDLCPECGEATLAYEEGCKKCYNCGFSEC